MGCVDQDDLDGQYLILLEGGEFDSREIAMHLSRFAEARCMVRASALVARLEVENARLRSENDMLFTRAAQRLAATKELQAMMPSAEVRAALWRMTVVVDKTCMGEFKIDVRKAVDSGLLEEVRVCYAWLNSLVSEEIE